VGEWIVEKMGFLEGGFMDGEKYGEMDRGIKRRE
jgi:hypothetical protein